MSENILKFYQFIKESVNEASIFQKGLDFTKKIKITDASKPQYKHLPCYEYVYLFMKNFIPNINPNIKNEFKNAYKKDIGTLPAIESMKLAKGSLQTPSQPETMRGLEYVNNKYKLGTIVPVDQAKVGDAISFWLYQFIEFSRVEKNYSFSDTEAKFNQWVKTNKIDVNKLPEWLIEGVKIENGHYAIISAIDNDYLYLSSSGEKNGCNGIWNGVSKEDCSLNFTKLAKADLRKFQKMSFDNLQFKSTDELTNKRIQIIMRSYILRFIK